MSLYAAAIAGPQTGKLNVKIGSLWIGPSADKFRGFAFLSTFGFSLKSIDPEQIVRVVHLDQEKSVSALSAAARGVAGFALLGIVGLAAGALSAKKVAKVQVVGVELANGEKYQIAQSPKDKAWQCFILYAKKRGIYEENLGF